LLSPLPVDQNPQILRRRFDGEMTIFSGAIFGGDQGASMNIDEITIGKLIIPLGANGPVVVDSQMPQSVFFKPVLVDERIFCFG